LLIHRSAHTSHDPVCNNYPFCTHTVDCTKKKNSFFLSFSPRAGSAAPHCVMTSPGAEKGMVGQKSECTIIATLHPVYFYPNPPTFPYPWRHIRNSTPLHPRHPIASHEEKAVRTHTYIIGSSYIHVHTYTNSLYLSFLSVGARVSGEGFSLISWLRAQREAACHCTSVLKSCTK
jgi:hypothetical protein